MVREDDTGIMEKPMAVKHLRLGEVRNGVLVRHTQPPWWWVLLRLSLLAVVSCASVGWVLLHKRFLLQRLLDFQLLFFVATSFTYVCCDICLAAPRYY